MKNKISEWLYEAWNGHPFLLSEEAEIICKTRFDENFKWMNDSQIQNLVSTVLSSTKVLQNENR